MTLAQKLRIAFNESLKNTDGYVVWHGTISKEAVEERFNILHKIKSLNSGDMLLIADTNRIALISEQTRDDDGREVHSTLFTFNFETGVRVTYERRLPVEFK